MTQELPYDYEITWITTKTELLNNKKLVNDFFSLYEDPSNFPDPDEREEPHFIEERILEQTDDPHTHLMAFNIMEEGRHHLAGGCIVEFYPDSACVLVTYVFVRKEYRGLRLGKEKKKIGEIILKEEAGLKGLLRYFENAYGKKPRAVLFESNNPFETREENDSMPPSKRLKFFKSIGAKRVGFTYIQPPLGDDKDLVTNLYLLIFPDLSKLNQTIDATLIMRFIMELAKSLDRNKDVTSKSVYGLENYHHDLGVISDIPGSIRTLDPSRFTGLRVAGRNILIETCHDLLKASDQNGDIPLEDIPGAE